MRYLANYFIEQALNRGKRVAQLFGKDEVQGQPAVRWLSIHVSDETFILEVFEVFDEGSEDFLDITSFTPIGEDPLTSRVFTSIEEAMEFARVNFGAADDRYINESVIGDGYAATLEAITQRHQ